MHAKQRTLAHAIATTLAATTLSVAAVGSAQAQVIDTITGTNTPATSAGAPTAPSTGQATYYVAPAGDLTLSTPFTYNFGTGAWSAPATWSQVSTGVFTNGAATVNLSGFTPAIGTTSATWPAAPPSSDYTNPAYVSSVLGNSTVSGGTKSVTQQTDTYAASPSGAVVVSNGAGTIGSTAVVLDTTQTFPTSLRGPSGPSPNPAINTPGVTVASTTPAYTTGSYTVATSGTVTGSVVGLNTGGLVISAISGTGTLDPSGTLTAALTLTPSTSVTADGFATTGTLTVGGASVTNGITNTGGLTTDTLTVTDLSTTNGIVNTGNIKTDSLTTTGNAAIGGNAAVTGTLSVGGMTTTNGIVNTSHIATDTLTTTGALTVGGDATVAGALTVTGVTNTNGIANTGNISTGTLTTIGNVSIGGNAAVAGTLAVSGVATTNGIVNTGDISTTTLTTSGDVSVGGDLAVAGPATIAGTLTATGNAYLGGNAANARLAVTAANGVVVAANTNVSMGGNIVHNVGAGVAANDAVNLSQLQGVQTQLNNEIDSLTSTVQANRIEAQRGIASVSALNSIPALDQNSRFGLGVGVGTFHGQTAFALGANFRFSDHVTGKLAVGSASGETSGSAGIGVSF